MRSYAVETVAEQSNVAPIRPPASLPALIRQARGDLSQEDVAERLGVHVTTVQRWEAGLSVPRGKNALALKRHLGVTHRLGRDEGADSGSAGAPAPVTADDVARAALEAVRRGYLRGEHALEALRAVSTWKGEDWPPSAARTSATDLEGENFGGEDPGGEGHVGTKGRRARRLSVDSR